MKKKLLSMLLISAMCLSTAGDTVLAASADFELDVQAENEDFLTGSVELTDGTDEDSEVSEPGAPDDGNSGEDAGLGDGEDSGLGDGEDPGQDTELTDISGYEVELEEGPYYYDETGTEPMVTAVYPVGHREDVLEEDAYTVGYEDNLSPGTAKVIVKGEAGAGYTGETQKEFTISKLPQELDLGQEEISLNEKEETKIDLSVLTGQITVTPSEEGFVEIRESGEEYEAFVYVIKALKAGNITLTIKASGDEYYESFEMKVKITVTKADHHHTYLKQDENGAYTVYDTTKAQTVAATCQAPAYTLYKCEDPDCEHEEKIADPEGKLADHTWGDHQAGEDDPPTYADAGSLIHICQVCGEQEEIEEKDWNPDDYKLVQRLKNEIGSVAEEESKTLELTTYNDSEYGQYISFSPTATKPYQITLRTLEGDEIEYCFAMDDANLTELSNAETLDAGKTYYICVRGNGKCEVKVSQVQEQIDISTYEVKKDFDPEVPFVADGTRIEPDVEVIPKYDGEEVTYNVSYENNVIPGKGSKIVITGSGRYSGTIKIPFTIVKGEQELDLDDISLKTGETETLDLSSLVGEIELIPDNPNKINITTNTEAANSYTIKALEDGALKLTIQAKGNEYFKEFEKTITVNISKPEHHHTYLEQDANGGYTLYKNPNGSDIVYYEATCTTPAYTVYTCTDSDCGFSEKITDPNETLKPHEYEEEVIAPTCTSDGYTKLTCKNCGDTKEKENSQVDKLDHTFIYQETVEATENSRAYHLYQCKTCTLQKKEYFGCIKGKHTFEERVIAPTCTKDGYTKRECTVCGYSETANEVDALGHDMVTTEYPPTESSYGYTRAKCSRCGYYEDTITSCKIRLDEDGKPVSVHEGEAIANSESQPVCTRPGTRKYKCKLCKKIYEVEIPDKLPAKEHTWTILEGDEASCEEPGTRTCSVCNETETIPATGHKMVRDEEKSQPASYAEKGVEASKCQNQGCDETEETYTQRLFKKGSFALSTGAKNVSVSESSIPEGADGIYYPFTPKETKLYYVSGGENLSSSFCQNDYDLTDLGDTASLTAGVTYYVCVSGDGSDKITISNVTNFINIQKEKYQIVIQDDPESLVYSGDAVELSSIVLKRPDNTTIDVPEEWITYNNNIHAGKATVTVTGKGQYNGSLSASFTIRKARQSIDETSLSLNVNDSMNLEWELFGEDVRVTSEDTGKLVVLPTDNGYKIIGKAAGIVNLKVHAGGTDDYEGLDVTIPVSIAEEAHVHGFADENGEISETKIIAAIDKFIAAEGKPEAGSDIEVSVASKDCEEGTLYNVMCKKEGCGNYTIQYRDTRYAGKDHVYDEGVVVVKPTYETIGKLKRTCTECGSTTMEDIDVLERTDLGDLELELSDYAYTYDGKEKKPSVKLLDDDGKAISSRFYTVSYKNNKNPGDNTASVIVRPKSDAYCGSATATFTIAQVKLSTSAVTVGGKAKLTLKGIASVEDYEVSKRKIITWDRKKGTITGKKLGKVKLTIYGYDKEDNEVTVSVTISVVPKATSISKVKSKAKKQAVVTWKTNKTGGGYQIQYSMDKNFKKGVKTLKVTSNSKKSAVIRSLKRKKTYYFRIRTINAKSASLVSAWSKVKKVKIK